MNEIDEFLEQLRIKMLRELGFPDKYCREMLCLIGEGICPCEIICELQAWIAVAEVSSNFPFFTIFQTPRQIRRDIWKRCRWLKYKPIRTRKQSTLDQFMNHEVKNRNIAIKHPQVYRGVSVEPSRKTTPA